MPERTVEGKVAVVAGGASGIGRAVVQRLATEGARCVIGDVDVPWGEALAVQLQGAGRPVTFVPTDVRSAAAVARLFEVAIECHGGVDILVCAAGVGVHKEVVALSEEEWDLQVDVQLKGVFLLCREAARIMVRQGRGGRIITIGSTASAVARVRAAPHCASKAAVVQFTRVLALELGPYGITANVVAPGLTDVGPISHRGGARPDYQRAFIREVALGRLAHPDEQADAVLFFASDAARFITGQVLYVDGGYSAGKLGIRDEPR
jgi:NAD(P)-dependent dehydrogenase (short-subunit alcohol dehydrogenase family)